MRIGALLLLMLTSCEDSVPVAPANEDEIPERQFIFERITMEERRGERVLWRGTGRRADGDLSEAHVEDVELHYTGGKKKGQGLTVYSPNAFLEFDNGAATFENVRIVDEMGGTLEAGNARYNEKQAHIIADGPIEFQARGFTAIAIAAEVLIDEGRVEITGPVHGVFIKPPKP